MQHLGDITKIRNPPFVDCITFGSPCQDLSVAGRRQGLQGARSRLFMEAVRIIREMREASGNLYPTFAVWENVPGAFSSNNGEDFRTVLEELVRIAQPNAAIPRPDKRWGKSGYIAGDGYSLAWRTMDAQYWGVPQRRRRIALVVDFGGQRAGEILFERESVSGHSEPSIPAWKGIARNPQGGIAGHDCVVGSAGFNGYKSITASIQYQNETAATLEANMPGNVTHLAYPDIARTLTARNDGSPCADRGPNIICLQGNMIDRDVKQNGSGIAENETMFTLNATDVHGICCYAFAAGQGAKANGIGYAEEQAPTLRSSGGMNAMPTLICRAHGQANAEILEDCSPTLSCNHEQPIVFENYSQDVRKTQQSNTMSACTARCGTGENNMPLVAFAQNQRDEVRDLRDLAGTLSSNSGMKQQTYVAQQALTPWKCPYRHVYSKDGSFSNEVDNELEVPQIQTVYHKTIRRWIVRRLTPTECERLQGYPNGWTDIWVDTKGKRHKSSDRARYKALGNSIALPQWWWLICKMAQYLPERPTLGSLFDGIGGFLLVWETRYGPGTAVWASEIEPFAIAVTKKRFPESSKSKALER